MNKKTVAIILESIPVVSAVLFFALTYGTDLTSKVIDVIRTVTVLAAFAGGVFFFAGRALAKGDKAVLILGIFDWIAAALIIGFYILVIFCFGL